MSGYAEIIEAGAVAEARLGVQARSEDVAARSRPNFSGDLEEVLQRPTFRVTFRGYDQVQVENYVAWSELEIRSTRRAGELLADRYRACAVELDGTRQQLARSSAGPELWQLSERMRAILQLASEEAADLRAAGVTDAEQLRVQAEADSSSLLEQARAEVGQIIAGAHADADRIRAEATHLHAEAAAALDHARLDGEAVVAGARTEQDRISTEAAQEREAAAAAAADHLAHLEEVSLHERQSAEAAAAVRMEVAQRQLDEICRQRQQVSDTLRHLTDQVGAALAELATSQRRDTEPETTAA